jgi:hypothetical protein
LAVLSWSIIPLESFHHHEEHSLVCTDSKTHIEEDRFECELADFVLPVFTQNKNTLNFQATSIETKLLSAKLTFELDLRITNLNSRGPPVFYLLG